MIDEIRARLERADGPPGGAEDLRIAVAALLVEAAHADGDSALAERVAIARLL